MYPYIHIVLPSYGTFAVLGAIVVMIFLFFRIDKCNIPFSDFLKMFGLSIVYGSVGSRVLYIVSRIPWLITHFSLKIVISTVFGGGFVFYGGLLGVLLVVYRYSTKHNYDVKMINNQIAPAIPLFHSLGRIGCFFAGCCYGFKLPVAVSVFGLVTIDRFPTQIIESVFNLVLFVVIYMMQKKRKEEDWLKIYLLSYATLRFVVEFTRGDLVRGVFFGVSTSQVISLIIVACCCISSVRKQKTKADITDTAQ